MRRAQRTLIFGAIVWPLIAFASAFPEAPKITAFVTTSSQDCPILIKGFKLPEKVGDPPRVVAHNHSSKQIRSFAIQTLIGNSEGELAVGAGKIGSISSTSEPVTHLEWQLERNISPDGDGEAHDSILASYNLVSNSGRLHSNCLHIAVIVGNVEF